MDNMGLMSIILSGGSLISVILAAIKLFSVFTEKARDDGKREAKMDELIRDVDGIGRKVNHIEQDHKETSNKVIELESILVTKVDNILEMLKQHIAEDKK